MSNAKGPGYLTVADGRLQRFDPLGDPFARLGDGAELIEPQAIEKGINIAEIAAGFPAVTNKQPLQVVAGALE